MHHSHKGKQNQKSAIVFGQVFDNIKATIPKDSTLAYPDYMQGFEVYTDSYKLQLGAIITQ